MSKCRKTKENELFENVHLGVSKVENYENFFSIRFSSQPVRLEFPIRVGYD